MRVIDASITVAWLYPDEITPAVQDVFRNAAEDLYSVPRLWHLEVANVLLVNLRRGKYGNVEMETFLTNLSNLDVRVDGFTEEQAWQATMRLAVRHSLTVYDASYLELAPRLKAPLATLDRDLRRAAAAEGVPLLGME